MRRSVSARPPAPTKRPDLRAHDCRERAAGARGFLRRLVRTLSHDGADGRAAGERGERQSHHRQARHGSQSGVSRWVWDPRDSDHHRVSWWKRIGEAGGSGTESRTGETACGLKRKPFLKRGCTNADWAEKRAPATSREVRLNLIDQA